MVSQLVTGKGRVKGCVYGLPYCCFIAVLLILVLVTSTCFLRLHIIVCKLLLVNYFAHIYHSACPDIIHN